MTNEHGVFGMSVEVQYNTELRKWLEHSLKFVDKSGQAIFHLSGGRDACVRLLASCQQTCMTYTIAVCTVKNS